MPYRMSSASSSSDAAELIGLAEVKALAEVTALAEFRSEKSFYQPFTLSCDSSQGLELRGELLDLVRVSKTIRKFVDDHLGTRMPIPAQFETEVVACFLGVVQQRQTTGQFEDSCVPFSLLVPLVLLSDFLEVILLCRHVEQA